MTNSNGLWPHLTSSVRAAVVIVALTASPSLLAVTAPVTLDFPPNGQFSLDISNSNPNLIVVPHDRIIAINSSAGMLSDKRNTQDGAIIFATTTDKPFTLFIETEGGQAFSVHATPKTGVGKSYRLQARTPVNQHVASAWEQSQPYETLLVSLMKTLSAGQLPAGYVPVPLTTETLKTPRGLTARAEQVWTGSNLKVIRFHLVNPTLTPVALKESAFWQPGVRAVMFSGRAERLAASGAIEVYIIRDAGGGR